MKFKSILILLLSLLFNICVQAQDQRSLEIIVRDTTVLKPTLIVYQLSIGGETNFMGVKIPDETNDKNVVHVSPQEIEGLLKKEKFNYEMNYEKDYSITSNSVDASPEFYIKLKDQSELKRLFSVLKEKRGISGKIKNVEYESVEPYLDQIFKRAFAKAKKQAQSMAQVTGSELGVLLSYSEEKELYDDYMGLYKQMMKTFPYDWMGSEDLTGKRLEKKLIFKFALK